MTDHKKEITARMPDHVISPVHGHLTAADLMKISQVPEELMPGGQKIELHVHHEGERAGYRGDDLLRRFVPYFVIASLTLVLLGGIAAIFVMLLPMIVAAIGAIVSIIISLVATVIAGVVIAVGIGWLQTVNANQGKIRKR